MRTKMIIVERGIIILSIYRCDYIEKQIDKDIEDNTLDVMDVTTLIFYILNNRLIDEEYFNDCQSLVSILELSSCISFPGKVNLNEYYPDIDLMVLSSISEGQPMVILEGFCLAIPCVATNVGSCHELIYGNNAEDRALGAAGEVVPFGKPDLLAAAMIKLINNSELRRQCGEVGRKRVQRFYQENTNIDNYLELYQDLELGI